MALNLPNFLGYGPKDSAFGTALSHADRAAKSAYAPQREQQALQKEQLMNAFQSMRNQYAPKRFEQEEEQLRLANYFNKAKEPYAEQIAQNQATPKVGDLGQMFRDMEMVKQQFGEGSPQAQAVEEFVRAKITPSQEQQVNVDPNTGAVSFGSGGVGSAGSGKGSSSGPIIGPDGQLLYTPTTTTESSTQGQQASKAAFDVFSRHVEQPYIGEGSNMELRNDISRYKKTKDPELLKKITQAALSYKLLPEVALTSLQLTDTPVTQKSIAEQEKSIKQGWPEIGSWLTNNLPKEVQQSVNQMYNQVLEQAHNAKVKTVRGYFSDPLSDILNKENPANQNAVSKQQNTYHPEYSDEALILTSKNRGIPIEIVIQELEKKRRG